MIPGVRRAVVILGLFFAFRLLEVTIRFNAAGERGTVFGTASFTTQPGTLPPVLLLRSIEVEVAGRRLRLPASDTDATKQPERAPAETNAP
jgi:hypothetical protein